MNQTEFMLWLKSCIYELYAIIVFSIVLLCITAILYFYWFFKYWR